MRVRVAAPRLAAPGQLAPSPRRLACARSDLGDSLKETAALDDLIDKLLSAKSQQQVLRRRISRSTVPRFTV